ncbi:hypothetical protein OC834_002299 [Tilletia horrida]|nr:hypothetical protein OC834_002299 [Tilletia horrida]
MNWAQRGLRLTVVHRGALINIVLYRHGSPQRPSVVLPGDSYGKVLFDAVQSSWPASAKIDDGDEEGRWLPRLEYKGDDPTVCQQEQRLLALVCSSLPRLLQEAQQQTGASLCGSQLWAEITTSDRYADQEAHAGIDLVGDLFRNIALDNLPSLSEAQYSSMHRIDMSAIKGYLGRTPGHDGEWRSNVLPVSAVIPAQSELADVELVFKTICISTPPTLSREHQILIELDGLPEGIPLFWTDTSAFLGELAVLATMPAHPNVIPAPLALVTVADGSKLVGWLQRRFEDHPADDLASEKRCHLEAQRRLRLALELCRGLQHLWRHGFYHPDLSLDNTLLDGDRLILMDFQPHTTYNNKDGPTAPEAAGHWDVVLSDDQAFSYERCHRPVSRRGTIMEDWPEEMPGEVMERLLVFSLGSVLSRLLQCRVVFSSADQDDFFPFPLYQHTQVPTPGDNSAQEAWETLLPSLS